MSRSSAVAALSVWVIAICSGACAGDAPGHPEVPQAGSDCPCAEGFICVNWKCREATASGGCAEGFEPVPASGGTTVCLPSTETLKLQMMPVKLDILWVLDDNVAMAQEQNELSRSCGKFGQALMSHFEGLDVHYAVVPASGPGSDGLLIEYPPPPISWISRPSPTADTYKPYLCLADEDCQNAFGPGWKCGGPPEPFQLENLNCSVNSACVFHCEGDADCCTQFCGDRFSEQCTGQDLESCLNEQCQEDPDNKCEYACENLGPTINSSGCARQFDTEGCEQANPPAILTNQTLQWCKCLTVIAPWETYQATMEQSFKVAWLALDPQGPNAGQSSKFLRNEAYLLLAFFTNLDDCSIASEFMSPNFSCESDDDCPPDSACSVDWYFSQMHLTKKRLCSGAIKKDYYNVCDMLGEYKGEAHHNCAYDLSCNDCTTDEDCEPGWYCKQGKKCRPGQGCLTNIASYQNPPGTPIFSLAPVADYYSLFRSLKSRPDRVLAAAVFGDGLPLGPDTTGGDCPSRISEACLADEKLGRCQAYAAVLGTAAAACVKAPCSPGCEGLCEAKLACIRECFVASKLDCDAPTTRQATYICDGEFGKADFGSRYARLIEMFGPDGVASNVCSQAGMEGALGSIAELVFRRATLYCLPKEPLAGEEVLVSLVEDSSGSGPGTELKEGPLSEGGDYELFHDLPECCQPDAQGACTGGPALRLHNLPAPGAALYAVYVAGNAGSPNGE
jgi:hypothetical protein